MKGLILMLSFSLATFAWHTTGHFAVAHIAEKELQAKNPKLLAKLVELLGVLKAFTKENEHGFVESACFVDDIKAQSWKAFNAFHFYDYYNLAPKTKIDIKTLPKSSVNIASTLAACRMTLRNTRKTQIDDRLGKSLMLRFLIHLVGDVHQPLHAASRVSDTKPTGDHGGNGYKLSKPKSDLHSQWDHTLGIFTALKAPLEAKHWKYLGEMTKSITDEYTRDVLKEDLALEKVTDWIKKGKTLSKECYQGIDENGEITENYKKKAEPVIRRQIALGGYRLADMLIDTFSAGDLNEYFAVHQTKDYVDDDTTDDDRATEAPTDSSDSDEDDTTANKQTLAKDKGTSSSTSTSTSAKPNILKPKAGTVKDKAAAKDKPAAKKGRPRTKKQGYLSDNGDYSPSEDELDSEYDQNSAIEEDPEESEEEEKGFFARFFGAIADFFKRLFGG